MLNAAPPAHIYQIYYSEQTRASLDPGFLPLDNLRNERPDWREYWPIRSFLLGNELADHDYYGFFSPRFYEKTLLTAGAVHDFVRSCAPGSDVILFSPHFEQIALYANSFEQGICHHTNAHEAFRRIAALIDPRLDVEQYLMSSADTVYCNYFVAKGRFWSAWLQKCELIFSIAEANRGQLGQMLNDATSHGECSAPTKVFLIERVASALVATDPSWTVTAYDSMSLPHSPLGGSELALIILDALKRAYRTSGCGSYRSAFFEFREQQMRAK